jgi:Protein of unknown function (DUF3631)
MADGPVLLDFSSSREPNLNGDQILELVSNYITRYVHVYESQRVLLALWAAHTHAMGAASITPYLNINSATKQAGKTRLLEVLELLVHRPWLTGRVTAACLVRKVDQIHPTLLLDESDAAFQGDKEYSEALRGILNSGFQKGGVASCCTGQGANITFKDFSVFCAKAIAGIGNVLPDTVADRSIPIRLQRKKRGDSVARFRRRHARKEADEIRSQLSDWVASILEKITDAEPELPDQLTDRQQDGLEPLLAIADAAGGTWPSAARAAAVEIFGSDAAQDEHYGVQLLRDVRRIFEDDKPDDKQITSAELIEKLKQIETSPWNEWSRGKGLTPNGMARMLKPFGIVPKGTIREGRKTAKGYSLDSFQDAFSRYLTPEAAESDISSVTTSQPACLLGENAFSNRHKNDDVTDIKSGSTPHEHCIVTDATVANDSKGGLDTKEELFGEDERLCATHKLHRDWRFDGYWICAKCHPTNGGAA